MPMILIISAYLIVRNDVNFFAIYLGNEVAVDSKRRKFLFRGI